MRSTLLISLLSLSMIGFGVPAGASEPTVPICACVSPEAIEIAAGPPPL
jgi:hypothetical protein